MQKPYSRLQHTYSASAAVLLQAAIVYLVSTAPSLAHDAPLPVSPVAPKSFKECNQLSKQYHHRIRELGKALLVCQKQKRQFGKVQTCYGHTTTVAWSQCHHLTVQRCSIREAKSREMKMCRVSVLASRQEARRRKQAARATSRAFKKIAREADRVDGLAHEWTEGSAIGQLVNVEALSKSLDALSHIHKALAAASNASTETDFKQARLDVFNGFSEANLAGSVAHIKESTRKLKREGRALPDLSELDTGFDVLPLHKQRAQYREVGLRAVSHVRQLETSYGKRAAQLRETATDAQARSDAAFEASRFLYKHARVLRTAKGMVYSGPMVSPAIAAQAGQLEDISSSLATLAATAESLTQRYAKQARKAADYEKYLSRL